MKILNTPAGSYAKVLIVAIMSAILVKMSGGQDVFSLGLKEWATLMGISTFPVIINWLNPTDKRYGIGKE